MHHIFIIVVLSFIELLSRLESLDYLRIILNLKKIYKTYFHDKDRFFFIIGVTFV